MLLSQSRTRFRWGLTTVIVFLVMCFAGTTYAQFGVIPYYGKNRVKYDKFDWHIYTTDHFEIYYYPELEEHLGRVASYAESAYQQILSLIHI